jgi:hypothetical protein
MASVIHPELHADTHSSQLNIEVAKDTRHSNDGNIVTTNIALSISILPNLSTGVLEDSLTSTAAATHNTIHTAQSTNRTRSMGIVALLVRGSLSSSSNSTGVDSSAGTGRARNRNLRGQERTTAATDPGVLGVGAVHETILQEECCTVGNQGVTLHLSDTDTTTLGTTLYGLSGQCVDGTRCTHLELVVHHVTETLVVNQTHVDVGGEFTTRNTRVQGLVTVVVVACLLELLTEVVGGGVFLGELEGRAVLGKTVHGTCFAGHGLDHLGDGHTWGKSVVSDSVKSGKTYERGKREG